MALHRERNRWLAALLLVALLLAVTCLCSDVIFQTNDDNNIAAAASGGVTGDGYPGNGLTSYWYGAMLTGLYALCPSLPWHGLLLFAAQALSLAAVLRSLFFLCDKKKLSPLVAIAAFAALYAGVGAKFMVRLQFTATPGYCAAALSALLYTLPETKRGRAFHSALGVLLMLFGLSLRVKGGLLALPAPLLVGAAKLCKRDKAVLLPCLFAALFACAAVPLNDWLYEKNEPGWREYARFDRYSATLLDYHNDDETYALALEVTDWSPELIKLLRNWNLFFDERFTADALEQLSSALEDTAEAPSLYELGYKTGSVVKRYPEFRYNALCFALLGLCALYGLLRSRRFPEALLLIALAGSLLAVIAYFYGYLGRFPDRVAFAYAWPVYVSALLALLDAVPVGKQKPALLGGAALLLAGLLTFAVYLPDTLVLPGQSESRAGRARLGAAANAYAALNPEKLFVTDVTQAYYAFSVEKPPLNLLEWGNAMTYSPMYAKKLERLHYPQGFSTRNLTDANVRLLFADDASLALLLDCMNADLAPTAAVLEDDQGLFRVYRLKQSAP